jgi:AAA15 family ATPase/GTPase
MKEIRKTMSIEKIEIKDFLVFKGEFTAEFCPGVNVFIGGNGCGKTTVMRQIYYWFISRDKMPETKIIYKSGSGAGVLSKHELIFIPVTNMLSHSKSLLALARERKTPFLQEELDILARAQLGEINELLDYEKELLLKISRIISGQVVYENDTFYVVKDTGDKVEFSFEASGFAKFGLLWKLIRNGLLRKGNILLWEEPENSLNPELMPKIVEILLELSRSGVQIFLATHSEFLANEFTVSSNKNDNLKYFSLYKNDTGVIEADTDSRFNLLKPNKLVETAVEQYEREIDKGLGDDD